MTRPFTSMGLVLLLAIPVLAADASKPEAPKVERGTSEQHSSACALARSMAGKLGYKDKVKHEVSEKTCTMLAPNMDAENRAEFVRCCVDTLERGPVGAAAPPPGKSKPAAPPKSKKTSAI